MLSLAAVRHVRVTLTALALVASLAVIGCSSGSQPPAGGDSSTGTAAGQEQAAPPASTPAAADSSIPPAASALPPSSLQAAQTALEAYESARDELANDKTEGLAAAAGKMEEGAKNAAKDAPESLRPSFDRLSTASAKLKTDAAKIEAARASFGDVSEAMVALLSVEPALAQGRFVFECPMVDHYKKWIQVDDEIKNPYMGSRMLGCGMSSTWGS